MGLIKQTITTGSPAMLDILSTNSNAEVPKAESGTAAAVKRLQEVKEPAKAAPASGYKPRDPDKEAKGKTRCVQFEAALMSPAIAGMPFKNMKEYLALVREAAEEGVKFTFEE